MYLDKKDKYSTHIILDNKKNIYVDYTAYTKLDTGDYIIKRKGSLRHIIIKDEDSVDLFPVCDGWAIRDDTSVFVGRN